jgi:hypothetical protein
MAFLPYPCWIKLTDRRNAMGKRNLPEPFEIDKIRFEDCFTAPSLRHFAVLMTGWVVTVGTHTISQVISTVEAHESEHFASIYRFLSRARWEPDKVAAVVFLLMVETLFPGVRELILVIDDTLNNRVGKKVCGAGFQHDGAASQGGKKIGYGVCFVIVGLAVRLPGISDRVFCLPYAARLWWPKSSKVKPRGRSYKTKPELALELIVLTRSWVKPEITLRVVVDGGYSNSTVVKDRPAGVHITGKVRKDAVLYAPPDPHSVPAGRGRPRKKGKGLAKPSVRFNHYDTAWDALFIELYGKETVVLADQFNAIWYRVGGNEILSIVLVRDPDGAYPDTVLFDTDTHSTDLEIIKRFSHRWSIEITNRETKHLLGSADPQCRCENSVSRAPLMAYWSYCLVVVWFVSQFTRGKDFLFPRTPWYPKKHITFSDMMAAARRSHMVPRILVDPALKQELPKFNVARSPRQPAAFKKAKL